MVENNLISIQLEKEIKNLFKYYLEILEQLKLDKDMHDSLRKRVLDHSNDTLREIQQFLSLYDFTINPQRVEEVAKKRQVVFRKTITSPPVII